MVIRTQSRLAPSLSFFQGTAIAVSTVVGSGVLILPGTIYKLIGKDSLTLWIVAALVIIPFIFMFSWLGKTFPNAGGVTYYVRKAFPAWLGAWTEIIIIANGSLQMANTATTAGIYFSAIAENRGFVVTLIASLTLLFVAGIVNLFGGSLSRFGRSVLVLCFMGILIIFSLAVLISRRWHGGEGIAFPGVQSYTEVIPLLPLVLVAYCGYEKVCSMTEEFRHKHLFPLAIFVSFCVIITTYLLLATVVAVALPKTDNSTGSTSVVMLLSFIFGSIAGKLFASFALLLILSNSIAVTSTLARVIFASSRMGMLPKQLSVLDGKTQLPVRAIVVAVACFVLALIPQLLGLLSLSTTFIIMGYTYVAIYVISLAAFLKLSLSVRAAKTRTRTKTR